MKIIILILAIAVHTTYAHKEKHTAKRGILGQRNGNIEIESIKKSIDYTNPNSNAYLPPTIQSYSTVNQAQDRQYENVKVTPSPTYLPPYQTSPATAYFQPALPNGFVPVENAYGTPIQSHSERPNKPYKAPDYLPPNQSTPVPISQPQNTNRVNPASYSGTHPQTPATNIYKAPDYLPPENPNLTTGFQQSIPSTYKAPDYLPPDNHIYEQAEKSNLEYRTPNEQQLTYQNSASNDYRLNRYAENAPRAIPYSAPGYLPPVSPKTISAGVPPAIDFERDSDIQTVYQAPGYLPPKSSVQSNSETGYSAQLDAPIQTANSINNGYAEEPRVPHIIYGTPQNVARAPTNSYAPPSETTAPVTTVNQYTHSSSQGAPTSTVSGTQYTTSSTDNKNSQQNYKSAVQYQQQPTYIAGSQPYAQAHGYQEYSHTNQGYPYEHPPHAQPQQIYSIPNQAYAAQHQSYTTQENHAQYTTQVSAPSPITYTDQQQPQILQQQSPYVYTTSPQIQPTYTTTQTAQYVNPQQPQVYAPPQPQPQIYAPQQSYGAIEPTGSAQIYPVAPPAYAPSFTTAPGYESYTPAQPIVIPVPEHYTAPGPIYSQNPTQQYAAAAPTYTTSNNGYLPPAQEPQQYSQAYPEGKNAEIHTSVEADRGYLPPLEVPPPQIISTTTPVQYSSDHASQQPQNYANSYSSFPPPSPQYQTQQVTPTSYPQNIESNHDGYDYSKPQGTQFEDGSNLISKPETQSTYNEEHPNLHPINVGNEGGHQENVKIIRIIDESKHGSGNANNQGVRTLKIIKESSHVGPDHNTVHTIRIISEPTNSQQEEFQSLQAIRASSSGENVVGGYLPPKLSPPPLQQSPPSQVYAFEQKTQFRPPVPQYRQVQPPTTYNNIPVLQAPPSIPQSQPAPPRSLPSQPQQPKQQLKIIKPVSKTQTISQPLVQYNTNPAKQQIATVQKQHISNPIPIPVPATSQPIASAPVAAPGPIQIPIPIPTAPPSNIKLLRIVHDTSKTGRNTQSQTDYERQQDAIYAGVAEQEDSRVNTIRVIHQLKAASAERYAYPAPQVKSVKLLRYYRKY